MEKDDLLNSDNGLLAEPMPTYGTARAEADTPTDTLDDEADDCFSYPGSRSIDDVREHCLHFMEEKNDPSRWMTVEELDRRLHQRFPWLR